MMNTRFMLVAVLMLMSSALPLHGGEEREVFLLPLYLRSQEIPGAYGSSWGTEFVVHNHNGSFVFFGPCNEPSTDPPCPPASFGVPPGQTRIDPVVGFTDAGLNGRIFYAPSEAADGLAMSLRVVNRAATGETQGAEIPVVRTSDFRSRLTSLPDVPIDDLHRVLLRIYDPDDAHSAARLAVRIFDFDGRLLSESIVQLNPSGYAHIHGFPIAPAFASFAVGQEQTAGEDRVRIDIEPVTPSLRFYAFASVTNNRTQGVTTIRPQ